MKNLSTNIIYCIVLFMLVSGLCHAQWVQVGQDISGFYDHETLGVQVQISDDGEIIAFGAPLVDAATYNIGEVRIYENQNGTWEQMGESIVSEIDQAEFGTFMAMSGDGQTVSVATHSIILPNNPWRVGVYHYVSGIWQQWGDYLVEDTVSNSFGFSMKLSEDGRTLAAGAQGQGMADGTSADTMSQGYVKVFSFQENAWVQKGQTLKGSEAVNDFYGMTVSMTGDGNFLAVGVANYSDTLFERGRIYVFKYEDDIWVQHGDSIIGETDYQRLGSTISMSDDGQTIATSNCFYNSPNANGMARIYKLQPSSNWMQVGTDIVGGIHDFLGVSIDLSADGNILASGSSLYGGNATQAGEVRVFRYEGSDWQQWGDAIQSDSPGGNFGWSLSLSADGNTLVAGAPHNSDNTTDGGLVQVYTFGVTAIDEVKESIGINLFPNPSQGLVTLHLATLPKSAMVSIFDLTGKKVFAAPVLQMQSVMDISNLSNGLYVVRLETNEGVRIGKLVLNQ